MKLSFTIFRCQKAITTPFEDLSEEKKIENGLKNTLKNVDKPVLFENINC